MAKRSKASKIRRPSLAERTPFHVSEKDLNVFVEENLGAPKKIQAAMKRHRKKFKKTLRKAGWRLA